MRGTLRQFVLIGAIGLLVVGVTVPAGAETTTTGGGDNDSISKPPPTAEEIARGEVKLKAARAWAAAQRGEGSVAEYEAARQEYAAKFPNAGVLPAFERQDVSPAAVFTI